MKTPLGSTGCISCSSADDRSLVASRVTAGVAPRAAEWPGVNDLGGAVIKDVRKLSTEQSSPLQFSLGEGPTGPYVIHLNGVPTLLRNLDQGTANGI